VHFHTSDSRGSQKTSDKKVKGENENHASLTYSWLLMDHVWVRCQDVQRREQSRHHHGGACRGGLVVGERRRARRGRWRDERDRVSLVVVVVVVRRAPSSLRSSSPCPRSAEFLQEVLFLQRV